MFINLVLVGFVSSFGFGDKIAFSFVRVFFGLVSWVVGRVVFVGFR